MKTFRLRCWMSVVAFMCTSRAISQPAIDAPHEGALLPDAEIRAERSSAELRRQGWGVDATAWSGLGLFRDIQLPINRENNLRADGRKIGEENAEHLGLIMGGRISPLWRGKSWHVTPLEFSVLRMNNISGPFETMNASYSRFELLSRISREIRLGKLSLYLDVSAAVRRSEFNDGSDSHFVTTVPLGIGAKVAFPSWSILGYGHYAPQSRLGYSRALLFGGEPIKNSTATLVEYGGSFEMRLSPVAWLTLGAEQENIRIQIPDVRAYEAFGLLVQDPKRSRDYAMATSAWTLGVRKVF